MRSRILLAGAALAAFGGSLGSGFHFDDYAIFSDPALTSPSGWLRLWTLRQTRPLTYFTFWLNYQLGGRNPAGYHLLNLALHVGAVLLAFACLRKLLPERVALVAAALFAVHPLQAESVDYVWGRAMVLATLLSLAALLAWLNGRHWIAVAWFAAALLAKEEVAAFPLALAVLEVLPHGRGSGSKSEPRPSGSGRWRALAAMLGLSLAAGARAIYATAVTPGAPAGVQAGIAPWHYFLAQGPVIWRYLRLLVVPYGFTVDPEIHVPPLWLALAAWAAIATLAWAGWRYCRWIVIGLILLLPSSSIFPAADLAADRRMYFPLLAFGAAAAILLSRVKHRSLTAATLCALALAGISRTAVWNSDAALWSEAVRRAPHKVRPRIQLARAVPPEQALQLLAQARALAPQDPAVPAEAGKVLLAEGRADQALGEFGRALALDPRDARNYNNRGVALAALGQTEAACTDFLHALRIDPRLDEARANLRNLRSRQAP